MDYIVFRIVDFLIAICAASMVAITVGYVAHYHYGLSRLDIRSSALTGAAIFAVIFTMLVATEWIKKKSK
jgi:hypothetical protein